MSGAQLSLRKATLLKEPEHARAAVRQRRRNPQCYDVRPVRTTDLGLIRAQLGAILAPLYPGSRAWLDSRLTDAVEGRARCDVSILGRELQGLTIETPKGRTGAKLSTIWVRPLWRSGGLGSLLLHRCRDHWRNAEITDVWVTAPAPVAPSLSHLLVAHDFYLATVEPARYGLDRDEAVFRWDSVYV